MALAKAGDRRVVGSLVGGDDPERHVDMARPLDLAGGADPLAVGVEEEGDHRRRLVCGPTPTVGAVAGVESIEIHLGHGVEDEPGQVVLGQPVEERRGQQEELVTLDSEEVVGHGPFSLEILIGRGISRARHQGVFRSMPGGSCNRLARRSCRSWSNSGREPNSGTRLSPPGGNLRPGGARYTR